MMQAIVTVPLPFTDIGFPQHQTTEVERSSAGAIAQQQFSRRFADPANLVGDVGHFTVFL